MPPPSKKKSTDAFILPFLPQEPRQSLSISSHPVVSIRPISHPSVSPHVSSHSACRCPIPLSNFQMCSQERRTCAPASGDPLTSSPPDACQTFILPQSQCGHCRDGWQPPERDPADAGLVNLLIISFITHKEQLGPGGGGLGHPRGS